MQQLVFHILGRIHFSLEGFFKNETKQEGCLFILIKKVWSTKLGPIRHEKLCAYVLANKEGLEGFYKKTLNFYSEG